MKTKMCVFKYVDDNLCNRSLNLNQRINWRGRLKKGWVDNYIEWI